MLFLPMTLLSLAVLLPINYTSDFYLYMGVGGCHLVALLCTLCARRSVDAELACSHVLLWLAGVLQSRHVQIAFCPAHLYLLLVMSS